MAGKKLFFHVLTLFCSLNNPLQAVSEREHDTKPETYIFKVSMGGQY